VDHQHQRVLLAGGVGRRVGEHAVDVHPVGRPVEALGARERVVACPSVLVADRDGFGVAAQDVDLAGAVGRAADERDRAIARNGGVVAEVDVAQVDARGGAAVGGHAPEIGANAFGGAEQDGAVVEPVPEVRVAVERGRGRDVGAVAEAANDGVVVEVDRGVARDAQDGARAVG
jgi:hypothetical protein